MEWEEFLRIEAKLHNLDPGAEELLVIALPNPNKRRSKDKIEADFYINQNTQSKRFQEIYEKFTSSCERLATINGAGKLKHLHNDYLRPKFTDLNNTNLPQSFSPSPPYARGFKALIEDRTKRFCGRDFVFEAFEQFLEEYPNGYFTILGEPGMGKSSIAAKYVKDHGVPCYFNILADRRNTPEQFLTSIREQLISRYGLANCENADLPTLLETIKQKDPNSPLIIVVDALDEVEQPPGGENILYLPKILPEGVYFLMTRRPYDDSKKKKKRLFTEPSVKQVELDLRSEKYQMLSKADIVNYIRLFVYEDPDYKDKLNQWIRHQGKETETFIQTVAEKSQNNFMYLRYLLPAIAEGQYDDLRLDQLPNGLEDYYEIHWVRMGMETAPKRYMVMLLYTLKEIGTPITQEMMAEIVQVSLEKVEDVLDEWVEYLKKVNIEGEVCYGIYHTSFIDFLEKKRELDREKPIFQEVNARIAQFLRNYRQRRKQHG